MSAPHQNDLLHCLGGGTCLTIDDLDAMSALDRKKIINAMKRMKDGGYAERLDIGCYQITRAGQEALDSGKVITSGPRGKRTGVSRQRKVTYRQRAWRAMQRQVRFTIPTIAGTLDTVERKDNSNLEHYFRGLVEAGYLIRLQRREPGTRPTSNGFVVFELVRDTGECAPVLLSDGSGIYDHNISKRILFAEVCHA